MQKQADDQIGDAVRYTASYDASAYGSGYRAVVRDLEAQGYTVEKMKNTWATKGYRGVNTTLRAPSGQVFDLQFHSPESFAAKSEVHALYEERRASGTSEARRVALSRQMSDRFRMVPIPNGAVDVKLLEFLATRGIGVVYDPIDRSLEAQ